MKRGARVLACAPSNVAADNMLQGLVSGESKVTAVRIGHPARINEQLHKYTLDAAYQRSNEASIVQQSKRDLLKVNTELSKTRDKKTKRDLWA